MRSELQPWQGGRVFNHPPLVSQSPNHCPSPKLLLALLGSGNKYSLMKWVYTERSVRAREEIKERFLHSNLWLCSRTEVSDINYHPGGAWLKLKNDRLGTPSVCIC